MAYSKTLEFEGSHFQTKSAKFPWDPGNSRKQPISGRALTGLPLKRHISIWVQSAELISSGASTTRIFETSKKHLGVLCEWDQLDNAVEVVVISFGLTGRAHRKEDRQGFKL